MLKDNALQNDQKDLAFYESVLFNNSGLQAGASAEEKNKADRDARVFTFTDDGIKDSVFAEFD